MEFGTGILKQFSKIYIISFIFIFMRIEDKLYLVCENMVPAGFPVSSNSIRDHNVIDLINKLKENGIEINPADCEQNIEYIVLGDKKKSTVPLQSSFQNSPTLTGYILRNSELEIILEDYHKKSRADGKMGGTVFREDGILFFFKFNGTYREGNQIESAKIVLEEFYNK